MEQQTQEFNIKDFSSRKITNEIRDHLLKKIINSRYSKKIIYARQSWNDSLHKEVMKKIPKIPKELESFLMKTDYVSFSGETPLGFNPSIDYSNKNSGQGFCHLEFNFPTNHNLGKIKITKKIFNEMKKFEDLKSKRRIEHQELKNYLSSFSTTKDLLESEPNFFPLLKHYLSKKGSKSNCKTLVSLENKEKVSKILKSINLNKEK